MKKPNLFIVVLPAYLLLTINCCFAQWTSIPSPYAGNISTIEFANSNNGYAGGNTALLRTTDGGASWTSVSSGSVFSINDYCWIDSLTGYYAANNNIIAKTIDGGAIWTPQNPNASPYSFETVTFVDANTGFAGGSAGTLRKTINGGSTWTTISASTSDRIKEMHFFDANTGVICSENGKIRYTISAGNSWIPVSSGTSVHLHDMYFPDNTTGYIVGASGTILKTTDGGLTWSPLISGTSSLLFTVCFKDAMEGYVAGAFNTILKTIDGGNNWTPETSPIPSSTSINDMVYINNRYIAVANGGKIITNVAFPVGLEEINTSLSVSAFPNPCSDFVTFNIKGNKRQEELSIILLSVTGQEIKRECNLNPYQVTMDLEEVSPGIYIYQVVDGNVPINSGKLIIQ